MRVVKCQITRKSFFFFGDCTFLSSEYADESEQKWRFNIQSLCCRKRVENGNFSFFCFLLPPRKEAHCRDVDVGTKWLSSWMEMEPPPSPNLSCLEKLSASRILISTGHLCIGGPRATPGGGIVCKDPRTAGKRGRLLALKQEISAFLEI